MNIYKLLDRWYELVGRKSFAPGASGSIGDGESNTAVVAALKVLNARRAGKHVVQKHDHVSLRDRLSEARFPTELVRTDFMGMRPLR